MPIPNPFLCSKSRSITQEIIERICLFVVLVFIKRLLLFLLFLFWLKLYGYLTRQLYIFLCVLLFLRVRGLCLVRQHNKGTFTRLGVASMHYTPENHLRRTVETPRPMKENGILLISFFYLLFFVISIYNFFVYI